MLFRSIERSDKVELVLTKNAIEHHIATITASLEDLQIEMNHLTDQSKKAVLEAKTGSERDAILDQLRQKLQKKTDEILKHVR